MKSSEGGRGTAVLFFLISELDAPAALPPVKDPVPILQEAFADLRAGMDGHW